MVAFGEKLEAASYPAWGDKYLNYSMLKSKIADIVLAKQKPDVEAARVASALKNVFQGALDDQIIKCLRFYAQQRDRVLREVEDTEALVDALPETADQDELSSQDRMNTVNSLAERLQGVARSVQLLLEFVSLNMQAMRKILKKFAKNVDPSPPVPGYLALEIHHPHDPGWKVLQGTYLKPEVQEDLDAMSMHKRLAQAAGTVRQLNSQLRAYARQMQGSDANNVQDGGLPHRLVSMTATLQDLSEAEANAARNSSYVQGSSWAATTAGIFEPHPKEDHAVGTLLGISINCLNSALYMSNYNLLVPSVRSFLNHIGALPTAAGIVIGCCDLASMPSTVGYSLWTNNQYKLPLMFSGTACLVGNLILALSYDSKSLPLLYVARLVTGIGAARCISRRYIADFVAKRNRTAASAAFVGSSALGMALGPLMARIFQEFPSRQWHGVTFDPITMGAWTMTGLWIVFLVVTLFFFEDPMVKVRAAKAAAAAVNSNSSNDNQRPLLAHAANGDSTDGEVSMAASGNGHRVGADGHQDEGNQGSSPAAVTSKPKRHLFRRPSFRRAFGPTMVTVYALLVLKTAQQAYLDSLPLFTGILYDWSDGSSGEYVAVLCLSMLLVTFAVGVVSSRGVTDRTLCLVSLLLMLLGSVQLFFGAFPRWNFFMGGIAVLISTIISEGSFMSLESKVIHPAFAKGTWNAGLLSTEAGTLGRFTGNLLLSMASSFTGLKTPLQVAHFAKVLWAAVAVFVLTNLTWFLYLFKRIGKLE